MNTRNAQAIVQHVAEIAEVASAFYANYGKDYKMSADSPAEAWKMYRKFMELQAEVASLLDVEAIRNAHVRWEPWWERRDVINIALVNHLSSETFRLIERAAYLNARGVDATHSMRGIQETIAGLLHPTTRLQTLEHEDNLMEAAS